MKYMGSKRLMLQNGLGERLAEMCSGEVRFVDLFSGSGAVSWHVAEKYGIETIAVDLQLYSKILAEAVLARTTAIDSSGLWTRWLERAMGVRGIKQWRGPVRLTHKVVQDMRAWCESKSTLPITQAYGGHYFHPDQTLWMDRLRMCLPKREPHRTVALAALISAASTVAASPGHTAQPLRLKRATKHYIEEAWQKDVPTTVETALERICARYAIVKGRGVVQDANEFALSLGENDVVFIDPPYAGVQYSRFYHVLESIAAGSHVNVTGAGRYPPRSLRPQSRFCKKRTSAEALKELLSRISHQGSRAILTFPEGECSNGLSGKAVRECANEFFSLKAKYVDSRFSSLGGRKEPTEGAKTRMPRMPVREMILLLDPR
jgi:adenine-specific DNA-methyltransferase